MNTSLAIDAGNDSYNTATGDFNGRNRKNGTIDIGAVEYYNVLPVSFISLTAKVTPEGAQLSWKVASENNNKQYIITRSTDGKNYELVTKVKSKNISNSPLDYSYTDLTVIGGTYYYKLEQEDQDGKVNYLATQTVKMKLGSNQRPLPTSRRNALICRAGQTLKTKNRSSLDKRLKSS